MNKKELIDSIAQKTGLKKVEAEKVLSTKKHRPDKLRLTCIYI